MNTPHLAYMITEGFCFLYGLSILFRMNSSIGSQREIRQLRNMIYAYFGMLLPDIFYYLMEDGYLPLNPWFGLIMSFLSVVSIALGSYFWFRYVETRLHLKYDQKPLAQWLLALPLIFIIISDIVSLWTGWLFYADSQGFYQSTDAFTYVQGGVNYFYLIIPTVASLYFAFRSKSHLERGEYWTYAAYMIPPLITGLLEDNLPTVPILALGIFLIIQILFLMIQNMQIYNDALTNLNNRRHLNRYLEERLSRASAEHPVFLFMIDINGFKAINDAYGHVEGDEALRSFSLVLRGTAERYHAFAARYGGDEFSLVADGASIDPELIMAELQKEVTGCKLLQKKDANKPDFSISMGYTRCEQANEGVDLAFTRADAMLYAHKQEWHKNNP